MWKRMWRTWTIDKPAALGEWLWQILVVELVALLDRVTLRKIIALIPVVIVIAAYMHRIPIPPEVMLLGDVLAYIDIVSVILLVGLFTRAATVLAAVKQTVDQIGAALHRLAIALRMVDGRHRRTTGGGQRKQSAREKTEDEDAAIVSGLAWV